MTEATQSQESPRITTVTSENLNAYVDEQLGIAPPPTPEEAAASELKRVEEEKAARLAEEEDPTHDIKEHVDEEKRGRLNKRFSELTSKRKDAEAAAEQARKDAQEAREAAENARQEAQALRMKYEPPKSDELGPEPQPGQFNDINEYSKALKEWTTDKANKEFRDRQATEAENARRQAVTSAWNERQGKAKEAIADYEAVINGASGLSVSDIVRDAIIESEVGPQLLYHLAKNPDLVKELDPRNTPPSRALVKLGKLEAQLATKEAPPPANNVAEISKAPAPVKPLKGSNAPVGASKFDERGEFIGTYDEWKKLRANGTIR